MKWALLIFYTHLWQIEGFFGTEAMCESFIHEINDQRKAEELPSHKFTCISIDDEPIFYSR